MRVTVLNMTAPLSIHTIDVPSFLEDGLIPNEDDNCTFIPDNIPEQPEDIVAWLDKDDKALVLSGNSMISNKPDPLLNDVSIRDSPTLLNLSDIDPDQLGEMGNMDILDTSTAESIYFDQNCQTGWKTDKNMNSLTKDGKNLAPNKCDILEKLVKHGLTLEVKEINNSLQVLLESSVDKNAFPNHFILLNEPGHVNQAIVRQKVKSLEKTSVSLDLNIQMACLQCQLGLRVWFCPLDMCRRAFYRLNVAKLHSLQHLNHKPFKCNYPNCKWAFYTSCKLKRHQDTHSKRKDFICSYPGCDRSFTTIYNLNCHRRSSHESPESFPCTVKTCDKKFQNLRSRELHLKTHGEAEAPYKCPVSDCGKVFFLCTGLSSHTRIHSHKESELRCHWANCGRVFQHPCRLKQHILQHTGQRPYTCTFDKCKWAFPTASKLKRHLNSHTNERKFHCTMGSCNKSFLRSQHLKDHTLTHIGHRSFHCDECNVNFPGKAELYLHTKTAHPKPEKACARAVPYKSQTLETSGTDNLLEEAIQSLDVPSDLILSGSLLPDEPLELLENEHFSTVNLRDLE